MRVRIGLGGVEGPKQPINTFQTQQTSCVPTQPPFGIVCGKMCQVKFFFLLSPCVCSSDFASPQEIKREKKKSSQIQQVANKLCRAAECQIFSSVPDAVGNLIDGDTICALRPSLGGCSTGFVFVPPRSFSANSAVACRAERFGKLISFW